MVMSELILSKETLSQYIELEIEDKRQTEKQAIAEGNDHAQYYMTGYADALSGILPKVRELEMVFRAMEQKLSEEE